MLPNLRNAILRQTGLSEVCVQERGHASFGIGLIDGMVNVAHPAFQGYQISRWGESQSARAMEHATFNASILVGHHTDQLMGRIMGLCPGCALVNYGVVTDEMLSGTLHPTIVARALATAVQHAVNTGCRIILLGIEIHLPESIVWNALRESIRTASANGSLVIIPAGNRNRYAEPESCCWPEALVVSSCTWRGERSLFSPFSSRNNSSCLAPGEFVPGAGANSDYSVLSGTSFAAAIVAGALSLGASLFPNSSLFDLASILCPPPHRILNGKSLFSSQYAFS